uniref:START domain-containing protein n=1 Tax=Leersia perrieri TaxID=77586 RepID=A0A0D9XQS8_9ORYZ
MSSGGGSPTSSPSVCSRSWSISEDSLKRYVSYASESCIQELLAASDSGGDGGGGDDGWKVLAYCNGVEISKRRAGAAHVFRSRWLLHAAVSPAKFMALANAVDAAKQWESDLVDARYIKDLGDDLTIIHLKLGGAGAGDNSKPPKRGPFRRRDVVVYERRQTMDDGTLVVAVSSLPKEIAAGLLPPGAGGSNGNGGATLLQSTGWVVEKADDGGDGDGGAWVATHVVQLDPAAAGWLPRCFATRLSSKLVMVIVAKLKKMAVDTMRFDAVCGDGDEVVGEGAVI